jgi:GGDEF domain-containing protein
MGVAIVGMHYTGMAAATFPNGSVCLSAREGVGTGWLAILIIVVTLAVLTIALLTSVLDARLESRTAKLARSLAEANEELTQMVLHDQLTKLPNRTLLEDRLTQSINKASRHRGHFALMFMDLDGFKAINDSLGHHVGDRLLVEVAQRLLGPAGARHGGAPGGDEFVILVDLVTGRRHAGGRETGGGGQPAVPPGRAGVARLGQRRYRHLSGRRGHAP